MSLPGRCPGLEYDRPFRATRRVWLALAFLAAFPAGCQPQNEYVAPPPPEVTVARPIASPIPDFIEATGTTSASATVDLRSRVEGYLREIRFEDGDVVREKQVLFVLERGPFETAVAAADAELEKAQAALDLAKAEETRTETLFRRKAVSQNELEIKRAGRATAQAEVKAAAARLKQAKTNLGYAEIHAPFTGRIGRRLVDVGNLVQAETTLLATLERFQPIYAHFHISERDFLRLRRRRGSPTSAGADAEPLKVLLGLSDEKGFPHRGYVDFRSPGIDSGTGTLLFRATFTNEDESLVPGLFARVRVPIGEPRPRLLVESRAVAADQRGDYVLVVRNDGTIEYRPVTLGIRSNGMRVVETGLRADDWVVVNGLQRARPGAKVAPQRTEMKPLAAAHPQSDTRTAARTTPPTDSPPPPDPAR